MKEQCAYCLYADTENGGQTYLCDCEDSDNYTDEMRPDDRCDCFIHGCPDAED